jgi:hypothetical protein
VTRELSQDVNVSRIRFVRDDVVDLSWVIFNLTCRVYCFMARLRKAENACFSPTAGLVPETLGFVFPIPSIGWFSSCMPHCALFQLAYRNG